MSVHDVSKLQQEIQAMKTQNVRLTRQTKDDSEITTVKDPEGNGRQSKRKLLQRPQLQGEELKMQELSDKNKALMDQIEEDKQKPRTETDFAC